MRINQSTRALSQLSLGNLRPRDGLKKKRRWGRGTGSGRGKMQGRGHQFSHATPLGFEGGQTPLYKRLPKFGMKNLNKKDHIDVNVGTIQQFIDQGRLVPRKDGFTTMRDLMLAGITHDIKDGIKLLGGEGDSLRTPIHLEVSKATPAAIQAIEKAGGTVTCTYFNTLALRVLTKPYKFDLLPWRARPAPKPMQWYLDKDNCGYLSPEIQKRNLKLFGTVTSEKMYREEHEAFMAVKRIDLRAARDQQTTLALEKYNEKLQKKQAKDEKKKATQEQ